MFNLGMQELLVIFLITLLLFGGRRLPEVARTIGNGMRDFRKALNDVQRDINLTEEPRAASRPQPQSLPAAESKPEVESKLDSESKPDAEEKQASISKALSNRTQSGSTTDHLTDRPPDNTMDNPPDMPREAPKE